MSTNDTWILVPVPSGRTALTPISRRIATRVGLVLLAWADHRRDRTARSVDLGRAPRAAATPRPFC